ncbi:unnamed protein product [Amoebophrya sp. A120]|nr:unnamed protein product [Amoebophrya sp. A120]|eukprot:GSA120T00023572001.1
MRRYNSRERERRGRRNDSRYRERERRRDDSRYRQRQLRCDNSRYRDERQQHGNNSHRRAASRERDRRRDFRHQSNQEQRGFRSRSRSQQRDYRRNVYEIEDARPRQGQPARRGRAENFIDRPAQEDRTRNPPRQQDNHRDPDYFNDTAGAGPGRAASSADRSYHEQRTTATTSTRLRQQSVQLQEFWMNANNTTSKETTSTASGSRNWNSSASSTQRVMRPWSNDNAPDEVEQRRRFLRQFPQKKCHFDPSSSKRPCHFGDACKQYHSGRAASAPLTEEELQDLGAWASGLLGVGNFSAAPQRTAEYFLLRLRGTHRPRFWQPFEREKTLRNCNSSRFAMPGPSSNVLGGAAAPAASTSTHTTQIRADPESYLHAVLAVAVEAPEIYRRDHAYRSIVEAVLREQFPRPDSEMLAKFDRFLVGKVAIFYPGTSTGDATQPDFFAKRQVGRQPLTGDKAPSLITSQEAFDKAFKVDTAYDFTEYHYLRRCFRLARHPRCAKYFDAQSHDDRVALVLQGLTQYPSREDRLRWMAFLQGHVIGPPLRQLPTDPVDKLPTDDGRGLRQRPKSYSACFSTEPEVGHPDRPSRRQFLQRLVWASDYAQAFSDEDAATREERVELVLRTRYCCTDCNAPTPRYGLEGTNPICWACADVLQENRKEVLRQEFLTWVGNKANCYRGVNPAWPAQGDLLPTLRNNDQFPYFPTPHHGRPGMTQWESFLDHNVFRPGSAANKMHLRDAHYTPERVLLWAVTFADTLWPLKKLLAEIKHPLDDLHANNAFVAEVGEDQKPSPMGLQHQRAEVQEVLSKAEMPTLAWGIQLRECHDVLRPFVLKAISRRLFWQYRVSCNMAHRLFPPIWNQLRQIGSVATVSELLDVATPTFLRDIILRDADAIFDDLPLADQVALACLKYMADRQAAGEGEPRGVSAAASDRRILMIDMLHHLADINPGPNNGWRVTRHYLPNGGALFSSNCSEAWVYLSSGGGDEEAQQQQNQGPRATGGSGAIHVFRVLDPQDAARWYRFSFAPHEIMNAGYRSTLLQGFQRKAIGALFDGGLSPLDFRNTVPYRAAEDLELAGAHAPEEIYPTLGVTRHFRDKRDDHGAATERNFQVLALKLPPRAAENQYPEDAEVKNWEQLLLQTEVARRPSFRAFCGYDSVATHARTNLSRDILCETLKLPEPRMRQLERSRIDAIKTIRAQYQPAGAQQQNFLGGSDNWGHV